MRGSLTLRLWVAVSGWRRLRRAGHRSARALAALAAEDLCNLSEAGQRLRQTARRQYRFSTDGPKVASGK
jgi:hypothetical protein